MLRNLIPAICFQIQIAEEALTGETRPIDLLNSIVYNFAKCLCCASHLHRCQPAQPAQPATSCHQAATPQSCKTSFSKTTVCTTVASLTTLQALFKPVPARDPALSFDLPDSLCSRLNTNYPYFLPRLQRRDTDYNAIFLQQAPSRRRPAR